MEPWGTEKKSSDASRYPLKGEENKPLDSDTNPNSRILKHPNASKDILTHFFEYLATICKGEGKKQTLLKSNLFQLLRPSIVTAEIYICGQFVPSLTKNEPFHSSESQEETYKRFEKIRARLDVEKTVHGTNVKQ